MSKKIFGIVIITSLLMAYSALCSASDAPWDETAVSTVNSFLAGVMGGDFEKVDSMLSPSVRQGIEKMGVKDLKELWSTVEKQLGPLTSMESPYIKAKTDTEVLIITPGKFTSKIWDLHTYVTPNQQIAGFTVQPHIDPNAKGPGYADTAKFDEIDLKVGTKDYPLNAKLTVPKGLQSFPVLVMLSGSGPNDMDESVGPNKPFRDLAWGLASRGIAVLRFDKRTAAYRKLPDAQVDMLDYEYIEDGIAAIDFASNLPGASKVFLGGHSEGAMLAPYIATKKSGIAGVVCLAGPVTPLQELIVYQYKYLSSLAPDLGPAVGQLEAALKEYNAGVDTKGFDFTGLTSKYLRELDAKGNPAKVAASLKKPLFLTFGSRDYQVPATEAELWKAELDGDPQVTLKIYEGMNHLLFKGEGQPGPNEYMNQNYVDPSLVDDLATWVKSR
jgi:dienelactone hydrolase